MELKQVKTNKRFFNKAQNLRNIIAIIEEYKKANPLFGNYKNLIEEIEKKEQEEQDAEQAADNYYLKNHKDFYNNSSEIAENYDKLKSIADSKYHELIKLKELKKEACRAFIDKNITLELFMLINSNRTIKRLSKIFGEHLDGFLLEALREYGQNGGFSGGIIECNAEVKNKFKKSDYYEHYINEYNNHINQYKNKIDKNNKILDCVLTYSDLSDEFKKELFNTTIEENDRLSSYIEDKNDDVKKLSKELEQSKIAVDEFNNKKAEFLKAYDFFGLTLEQPKVKATNDFSFDFNDEIKQEVKKPNKNRL